MYEINPAIKTSLSEKTYQ